jgi:hypothetical protein
MLYTDKIAAEMQEIYIKEKEFCEIIYILLITFY